ncbi:ATP-binding protein [Saccharibacillus endophyticus]
MLRRWKWPIAVLIYIIVVFQYFYTVASNPNMFVEVLREPDGSYRVTSIVAGGWGEKYLEVGNRIIAVNGQDPAKDYIVGRYGELERVKSLDIVNAQGESRHYELEPPPLSETLQFIGVPLAASFLFLIFVAVLWRSGRSDPSSFVLALFFLFTGAAYIGGYTTHKLEPVGTLLFRFLFLMVPVVFIHFMNMYLKRFNEFLLSSKWMIFFYACLSFELALLCIRSFVKLEFLDWATPLFTLFFAIPNVIAVIQLIRKYRKHRKGDLNSLFKLTLITHILAFSPFIVLYSLPLLIGSPIISVGTATAFLLVLPLAYMYMLMTRRIFDVNFVLNRFFYHASVAVLPSAIMALLGMWIVRSEGPSGIGITRMFLIFYLVLVILLFVKEALDRKLRQGKGGTSLDGNFERFSHNVARVMKRADLERALEQEIKESIRIPALQFFDWDTSVNEVPVEKMAAAERREMAEALRRKNEQLVPGSLTMLSRGACLVIGRRGDQAYLLWLDDKADHTRYNPDERNRLVTLANYSAIVFENLYLVEGLIDSLEAEMEKHGETPGWVLRLIFNLSENERRRLASDLHDSALQDQIIWLRRLETAIVDYEMSGLLKAELDRIKEGLLDVIHQIRETCNELRPPLLMEMGLEQSLEQLFTEAQMRADYIVDFQANNIGGVLDDEQTLAIYRITQELLRNADKHADASNVEISMFADEEAFYYRYRDDGVGMNEADAADSFSHMGLAGMKERVRSFEGTFEWHSRPGAGMETEIIIPLKPSTDFSYKEAVQ